MIDVVKFDGIKNRNWIVYKFPSDQLVYGTQLIVQEGQVAIFVKGGQICDVFFPGTHGLDTYNLPILKTIVNIPFGGKTPFSAEIYFLNTVNVLDLKWGTLDPIQLIDPKYNVRLRIRAYGQMGLKLQKPALFFKELIGGIGFNSIVEYDKTIEFCRGKIVLKIKTLIAQKIISQKISALEISTQLEELSQSMVEEISDIFDQYGLGVVNFFINSINFPDEDFEKINQILQDKAAFDIMGDNMYKTKRSFDVYEGAATNENGVAGAFAAGGIGLGAAMNIGANMNSTMGNPLGNNEPAGEYIICPSCSTKNLNGVKFCSECGHKYAANTCSCGEKLSPNQKFCPECGKKVE